MEDTVFARLPKALRDRAMRSGSEHGWARADAVSAMRAAREAGLANLGFDVQFVLPGGTCELYWCGGGSAERQPGEPWSTYIARSLRECEAMFGQVPADADLVSEGTGVFAFLQEQAASGADVSQHLVFVLAFSDEYAPREN